MGKSNEQILCKLSNGEILRLYLIVHVAMETTKTSNVTCQSNTFISIFFTCHVSACELQPFSCHNLANDLYSETGKTVFSHLKLFVGSKPVLYSVSWSWRHFQGAFLMTLEWKPWLNWGLSDCSISRNRLNSILFNLLPQLYSSPVWPISYITWKKTLKC